MSDLNAIFIKRFYDQALSLMMQMKTFIESYGGEEMYKNLSVDEGIMLTQEMTKFIARLTHVMSWYLMKKTDLPSDKFHHLEAFSSDQSLLNAGNSSHPLFPEDLRFAFENGFSLYLRVLRLQGRPE